MGKLHVQQNTFVLHGGLLSAFEYSFVGWWSVHVRYKAWDKS